MVWSFNPKRWKHLITFEKGQGLVEYALILVLVAIVTILVVGLLGEQIQDVFCEALYGLGDFAPEVEVCKVPNIRLVGISDGDTVDSPFNFEVVVNDDGGMENIAQVEFYIDGNLHRIENHPRFCFGGTDDCSYNQNVTAGTRSIRVVATDSEGYSDEVTITVHVQ
jgi:pilus assembly protein Flp/PilA